MAKSRVAQHIVLVIGLANVLFTAGSALGRIHWTLDVLSHFNLQYTVTLAITLILGAVLRVHWRYLLVMAGGLLLNAAILFPYFLPPAPHIPDAKDVLRLASFNVGTTGDNYPETTDYILEHDADLVVITEVRQDLIDHLETTLADTHPYVYAVPSRHTLGLAFVSKYPFTNAETVAISERRRFLSVSINWQGQDVTFFSVHPLPPLGGRWAQSRNNEFLVFEQQANTVTTPLIMMGDYNASPWSAPLRRLSANTGLRYAGSGFGVRPTWHVAGVIRAPLDYMLVSDEWEVLHYRASGSINADHIPVIADVRLREG